MRFDMSRAWNDAIARISANREVMMVIAGVFFLLPSLVFSFFYSGTMTDLIASLPQSGEAPVVNATALESMGMTLFFVFLAIGLVQMIGYTAMLAVLDDDRPTVGEALSRAIRFLPTLIGLLLLLIAVYFLVALLAGLVIGAIMAASGLVGLAILLGVIAFVGFCYLLTRISLATAAMVYERRLNPFSLLTRSWSLTGKDGWRLFGFYVLLFIVYMVISLIVGIVVGTIGGLMGTGSIALIVVGLISGAVGAAANTIFTGVIAAVYRQLAGPSTENLNQTFG